MRFAKLNEIIVSPERIRLEFDPAALEDLADSIRRNSLFHPLVVRDGNVLAGGERRLRVLRDMAQLEETFRYAGSEVPLGLVPVTDLGELDEMAALEVELEENTRRKDLSWQETADAYRRLHELRVAQRASVGEKQTVTQTASEIFGKDVSLSGSGGGYVAAVSQAIAVARHLDNPLIAKAGSFNEAYKILKKEEQRSKDAKVAAAMGPTWSSDDHSLIQGNCLEVLKWPEFQGAFDVICTDPPYGMGADEFGDAAGKLSGTTHNYSDDPDSVQELLFDFLALTPGICKPAAHLYICCDFDWFHWIKEKAEGYGWKVFRTPIVNHKRNSGRVPWPEHGPRRTWEIILYAYRGKKPVTAIYEDFMETDADPQLAHGAQKPVAMFRNLLQRSVRPGDRVVDPFVGTGSIFPAAHELKVRCTGIELDSASYGTALQRLERLDQ